MCIHVYSIISICICVMGIVGPNLCWTELIWCCLESWCLGTVWFLCRWHPLTLWLLHSLHLFATFCIFLLLTWQWLDDDSNSLDSAERLRCLRCRPTESLASEPSQRGSALEKLGKLRESSELRSPYLQASKLNRVFTHVNMSLIKLREERLRRILSKADQGRQKPSALSCFVYDIAGLCLAQRPRCIKIDGNPYAIAVGRMLVNQTQMEKSRP